VLYAWIMARRMLERIAISLFVVGMSAGTALAQPILTRPGTYELTLPGSERRYTLVLPRGYLGAESVPLVMALHYGGRVTPYIGRGFLEQLVEPALRELGAILVAPDSAADGWANPTAERHVIELLSFIESNYKVDKTKTLLTGYSMGGMGTWYLAPRHPELFEAAIPMAGRPQADSTELDWRTPTYVINSAADELIAIGPTRDVVGRLKARGAPIEMVVIDDVTHYEVPRYREHLKAAIPWLRGAWSAAPPEAP
jgi:predicted peptidase